ncbi:Uncharacterised protein [Bartonella grahamii]|uniref:Uncharacterized protein n=1 Tax=Bartonella grahamii TaxID=33045 RepID=A0A336NFP3_BARGR|nr:Uncharacterised protein [Bartonella grahamii]
MWIKVLSKRREMSFMNPLNANIIVTLKLEKSMIVSICTFYFSKNEEHNVFYTIHGEYMLF